MKNHSTSFLVSPRAVLVALALVAASTAAFAQGTEAQRKACTPDVFRLCSSEIPNVDKIIVCMKAKKSQLSPGCLAAVNSATQTASNTRSIVSESQQWCATGPQDKLSDEWQSWCGAR